MKCPNCGATLVFDAATGLLECRSCDSTFAPDEGGFASSRQARAEERMQPTAGSRQHAGDTVDFASYVCSSCGAELVGTYDTSAIGFCSYCGGENIIASRIAAQRPDRIVPFSRTKEDCKEIYLDAVKDLKFVPKELKEERHVDEIRGIYVPYSIYRTHHKGAIDLEFTKHDSSYNYRYGLSGKVTSDCAVPIDASTQLDDYIGSTVFPYEPSEEVPFQESYLSTYYVELPDADDAAYMPTVREKVLDYENGLATRKHHPDSVYDQREASSETVEMTGKDIVLAPLYFLTYRNKDKVCYTVLPGTQDDDSMYAEIPIDVPKYMLVLFALAVVLWAVLSFVPFVPTLPHNAVLLVMGVLSLIALCLHKGEYDKQHAKNDYFGAKSSKALEIGLGVLVVLFIAFGVLGEEFFSGPVIRLLLTVLTIAAYVSIVRLKLADKAIDIRYSHVLFAVSAIMIALGFADTMMTIPDEVMYIMMFAAFAASLIGFLGLIRIFNASCERERPHFTRKGGHDAAQDI